MFGEGDWFIGVVLALLGDILGGNVGGRVALGLFELELELLLVLSGIVRF